MKAQGLVQDKNLGQAVTRSQRASKGTTSTSTGGGYTASGREQGYARHQGQHGYGWQGNAGRGPTYASGSDHSGSGNSGGGVGRGGK